MTITSLSRNFNGDPNMVTMVTTSTKAQIQTAGFWDLPDTVAAVLFLQNAPFQFSDTDFFAVFCSDGFSFYTFDENNANFVNTFESAGNVVTPTVTNYVPTFRDAAGTLGMPQSNLALFNANIVIDPGEGLFVQPALPGTGRIGLFAQDTGAGYTLFINNEIMSQNTTVTIPNILGNVAGRFLVIQGNAPFAATKHLPISRGTNGEIQDSGAQLLTGVTATFAGGAATNTFTIAGLTAASVGSCVIKTSTNTVQIAKAVAGAGTLAVTFSADPGANTTLTYIYTTIGLS